MPFGKHKGVEVADLDDGYINWLYTAELHGQLKTEVQREWTRRFDPPPPTFNSETERMAFEIVAIGYRELALTSHPDRGGNTELMKAVNAAKDFLRRVIRRELKH